MHKNTGLMTVKIYVDKPDFSHLLNVEFWSRDFPIISGIEAREKMQEEAITTKALNSSAKSNDKIRRNNAVEN